MSEAAFRPGHIKLDNDGPTEGGEAADPRHLWHAAIARRVGERLQDAYPSHPWKVDVPVGHGVVKIQIPILMRRLWMVIKIHELDTDPNLTSIVRAGGEILERYGLPRGSFRLDKFLEVRAKRPVQAITGSGWIPS